MNHLAAWIKHHALLAFCALTIACTFATTQLPISREAVPVVMVFIPALVALSLVALTDGWTGVQAVGRNLGRWRIRPVWVVVAVVLGLVLRLTMSVIAVLVGWIPTIQLRPWSPLQLAFFAVILFLLAIPEELGWRGFAFPKLLTRYSPFVAGVVLGVLWGSLHLALTVPGMIYAGAPLLPLVLEVTGLAVLGTWLYVRSDGNLLVTSVFHAAQSFFVIVNEGITLEQQLWLMAGVFMTTALLITLIEGPRFTRTSTRPLAGEARRAAGQPSP